ncbi:MAG: 30S ribosomal protein S6 [Thermoanaerobaculum sp.]|nr:30S ribosomal protein S6 [Thermoanaerobaculum sp.]MCX7895177.1 30S ribosomal protein S6 [Thermoanaerobaculum sp.]MDW7968669.1 30S ribosomal protein S6 [Thermoanaerobaculum sp.]
MPLYELGVVLTPDLDDQARESFMDELKKLLDQHGATMVKEDVWGKRTLAYPIRHKREGFYFFWQFEAPGTVVAPLEYKLRLSDEVLRYLTLNLDRELRRARKMTAVRAAQQAAKGGGELAEAEPGPHAGGDAVTMAGEEA